MLLQMASRSFLESVQLADTYVDSDSFCSSSSFGWLSPRISFSKDFALSDNGDTQDSCERKEMINKDSNYDFEFSMVTTGDGDMSGDVMLPADELFYKGKLLPVYVPLHAQESSHCSSQQHDKRNGSTQVASSRNGVQTLVKAVVTASPSGSFAAMDQDPESPKTTNCSSGWRGLFGLRKSPVQHEKLLVSSEPHQKQRVNSRCKPSLTPKPLRLFLMSDDSNPSDVYSSGAKPPPTTHVTTQPNAVLPRFSNSIHSHSTHHDALSASHDHGTSIPLLSARFSTSPPRPQALVTILASGDISDQVPAKIFRPNADQASSTSGNAQSAIPMDTVARVRTEDGGGPTVKSSCQGRTLRAIIAGVNGETSPESSVDQSNPRKSFDTTRPRRSSGGTSIVTDPAGIPRDVASGKIAVSNLQRSSSSPQSLRKNHDYCRAGRPKDGWKGLERSTSYSASVRVAPVLNVPAYFSPALAGGRRSRNGFFGFGPLFNSKKEKLAKATSTGGSAENV